MTDKQFNIWDQAAQVLRGMPENHDLNTIEAWAIAYGIRCIERDKATRNSLTRTEQALKETEHALTGQFEAFVDADRYMEIESRR